MIQPTQRYQLPFRFVVTAAFVCAVCFVGLVFANHNKSCLARCVPLQDSEAAEKKNSDASTAVEQPVKTDFLGDPLPPHAIARLGTNRFCPSSISALALSVDENIVVTFGRDNSHRKWQLDACDAKTGKPLWQKQSSAIGEDISAAGYGQRPLCVLPQSNRLAVMASAGSLDFVDFNTGNTSTIKILPNMSVKSIDVSPDETLLALGGAKQLLVCDLQGNQKFVVANRPAERMLHNGRDRMTFGGEFSYGKFTPDGKNLVLVNSEKPKTFQIFDVATGELASEIETKDRIVRFDSSPDSKHLFATERDISARKYDFGSGEQVWEHVFSVDGLEERYTTDIQVSPTGEVVAVGTAIGEDQRIQLLDPGSGERVGELAGHTWKPWWIEFTANGKQMYSSGWDSVVRRWDIEKREQIRVENSERASGVCSMSPDGSSIAFCDDTGKVHVVDVLTGKKLRTIAIKGAAFSQVIFSQDSRLLAGGGAAKNDIHVYVWDLATGDVKHHWDWPRGNDAHSSVEALSFSRDATRLAAAVFRQSTCYVFDLPSDTQIAKTRHGNVYGLCMSPDGQQFVSAGWDKQIRLWDCETGEVIKRANVKDAANDDPRMYGVLFAPDGKSIATLSLGGFVRTWDLELEEPVLDFKIKSRAVYGSLQYSRNGLWLGVGRMNGGCSIYDVHSGEVVWDFANHGSYVYNVDFGADDRTLLTGGEDGVCYLWDLHASSNEVFDFAEVASDLIGDSPVDAFVAHQAIAAQTGSNLEKALQEIKSATDSMFDNWGDPDEVEPSNRDHRINRVAMLLAQLESQLAGELLEDLVKACPSGSVKKTIFLANKHRQRFLERVGKKEVK